MNLEAGVTGAIPVSVSDSVRVQRAEEILQSHLRMFLARHVTQKVDGKLLVFPLNGKGARVHPDFGPAFLADLHSSILNKDAALRRALDSTTGMAPRLATHPASDDLVTRLVENFRFGVTQELLCCCIPANDPLAIIHHVDRVL